MRLLILGGTKFLGRAVAGTALARGHDVTLFTRGQTNADLFPEAEHLHGDRTSDLSALAGRRFDAVVDTSGYVPQVVRASAELLSPAAEHYTFVSSVSVYPDYSQPVHEESALAEPGDLPGSVYPDYSQPVHEESALAEPGDLPVDALAEDYSNYGALKALCEREVADAFPGRSLSVRAGLIVGPHDPTGRFTYWPHRVARGGELLAPGPPERDAQFVDVRDLAAWILDATEARLTGPFNVTSEPYAFETIVDVCRAVTGSDARATWVDESFLLEHGVGEWMELPLWVSAASGEAFHRVDTTKAHDAGLVARPLEEIVRGTLDEAATVVGVGLNPERESQLLHAWHAR